MPKARSYRPFPSSPGPLYQNEVKCSAFDMEKVFHSYANKTHSQKKGCALGLILKVRVLALGSGLLKTRVLKFVQTGALVFKRTRKDFYDIFMLCLFHVFPDVSCKGIHTQSYFTK